MAWHGALAVLYNSFENSSRDCTNSMEQGLVFGCCGETRTQALVAWRV